MLSPRTMEVDAFVADSVVAAEGKLYVQGAGWNVIFGSTFPMRHNRVGLGVLVHVPYTATNQMHKLAIRLEDSDGNILPLGNQPPAGPDQEPGKITTLGGDFSVGRPPLISPGDAQIVPIAVNMDGLVFEKEDMYSFVVSIDGTDLKSLQVRAAHIPAPVAMVH